MSIKFNGGNGKNGGYVALTCKVGAVKAAPTELFRYHRQSLQSSNFPQNCTKHCEMKATASQFLHNQISLNTGVTVQLSVLNKKLNNSARNARMFLRKVSIESLEDAQHAEKKVDRICKKCIKMHIAVLN